MRKRVMLVSSAVIVLSMVFSAFGRNEHPVKAEPETGSTAAIPADIPDNTIIMYIGNAKAFVNDEETTIIKEEPNIAPYLRNGGTLVPLRFVAEAFGVETEWRPDIRAAVISAGNMRIYITEGSNAIRCVTERPGSEPLEVTATMSTAAEMNGGRLYIPARGIAEALGKEVFYDNGLIIISGDALSLDPVKDREYLDELFASFTGLERVGSKERLIELLGLEEPQYYGFADGAGMDMATTSAGAAGDFMTNEAEAIEAAPVPAAPESAEAPAAAREAQADMKAAGDYSETNVQVEGVDEADIIKTDGEYIYYVRGGKIEIVRAGADGKLELMSEVNVGDNLYFNEIFIDKDKIIAVGTSARYAQGIMPIAPLVREGMEKVVAPGYYGHSLEYTKAIVYDTSDKKNPKEERTVETKGRYISSRKTGDSVYFISSNYIYYGNIDDIAPTYYDSATGIGERAVGWDRVYHFPGVIGNSLTSITGIKISEPSKPANIETFVGAGENIYMSANNLYIASSQNYRSNSSQSEIYKFAISGGDIVYSNKGSVPGSLLNQFSMDEYDGCLRVGTTVYSYSQTEGARQLNCLYVLNGSMDTIGKIENIAPGERIYSVRFMGNRAYMVTFKQVDPLFAIDLSNPREPEIMGALKIPGYSDYLHPYDENHLIGFGKDTTLDKYGNAFYLGMKLSLFDITDIANPKEMFVEYIGGRGTESPLLSNHKALLFSKDKDLLAFPVSLYEVNSAGANELEYGEFAGSYAYVYSLTLTDGFNLRGRITHLSEQDMLKSSQWGGDYDKYIERVVNIGKRLYAASQAMITCSDFDTLNETDRLTFR